MSEQFKMVPASLLERLLDDPAMVVRMPSDSIVAIKAALSAPASDVDFWNWLDRAYRNGSQGDQPKFTKHNMEVSFAAGISAAAKSVESPVRPAGAAFVKPTILKETNVGYAASSGATMPPAGDVEAHHQYLCKGLYERWMPLQESEVEDAKREGFQVRELVDRAHVTRLTAEVERLNKYAARGADFVKELQASINDLAAERAALTAKIQELQQ